MTPEGYPDDDELKQIREWDYKDMHSCMDFIRRRWNWHDMFRMREKETNYGKPVIEYTLLTGGWSGNEELVHALLENKLGGQFNYVKWERGGKHVFEIEIK